MSVGAVNKQTGDRIPTAGMPAIDSELSLSSTNPVQNAIITAALGDKQDSTDNNLQTTDKTVVGAVNEVNSNILTLQSGKLNVIKKETGSGTTFTITFPTHGSRVYALLFGRFGYQQSKLSIAVISHATENEAYIMCLGDETAAVSCTGHVVTVTTSMAYATVDVVSPEDIS